MNGMEEKTISELRSVVMEKMSIVRDTAHSFEHVERVCEIAAFLTRNENADLELVQLGAILHDVGRAVGEPHNETGAELAREILEDINYPPEKVERIAKIVLRHRQSIGLGLETLEEKIVWDADKIDLIGVTGILRAFHWAGSMKIPFEDEVEWCRERETTFYGLLNTETAKKIARRRHEAMIHFLEVLEVELSLADLLID